MIYQGKQKIWADYQKEIPDDHWFYVRSCIRQNFFPASEKYFLKICRDHDIIAQHLHAVIAHPVWIRITHIAHDTDYA